MPRRRKTPAEIAAHRQRVDTHIKRRIEYRATRVYCTNCETNYAKGGADRVMVGDGDARLCGQCAVDLARQYETPRQARLRKYGLTEDDHSALFVAQKGRCAVCDESHPEQSLVIDHDHASGKVRGLLCGRCNTGLGMFHDNPIALARAIAYVSDPPAKRLSERRPSLGNLYLPR